MAIYHSDLESGRRFGGLELSGRMTGTAMEGDVEFAAHGRNGGVGRQCNAGQGKAMHFGRDFTSLSALLLAATLTWSSPDDVVAALVYA